MNGKRIAAMSASVIALLGMLTACAEGGGGAENTTTPPPSTMGQEEQSKAEEIEVKEFELENKSITFLASWARNPANGKNKDVALELFQTRYGGEVIDIVVPDGERYDKLASLVTTGNSPDFFSAGDMDAFPMGAINAMFQPLDSYIDYTDKWWNDKQALNEQFVFNGKHYVGAVGAEINVLMIYNKSVVAQTGSADPADLLKEGKWNWDTCRELMNTFCAMSENNYATDGWWVAQGFSGTTGVPYIGMKDGKVVNNLNDPLIEDAQNFLYNLRRDDMAYPVWDYGWVSNPKNIGAGTTLFYPCGIWALTQPDGEYGLNNYGDVKDVGFVPMPKCPYVDEYYIPARVTGYMLVSGAPNPEGVACYLYCEAAAVGSEEAEQITHDQYINEYGWTEDMWEMRNTIYDMLEEHPCFDFYIGVSAEMKEALDNPIKDSYHQGNIAWTQTKEEIYQRVQTLVDTANASLES